MTKRRRWLARVRCARCGRVAFLPTRTLTVRDRPSCHCGGGWIIESLRARRAPDEKP